MTLEDLLEPDAYDPALPVITTAERIALSHAISARRLADVQGLLSIRDRLAIAAVGALSGRLLSGREEHTPGERNKIIRRLARDAYLIADQAMLERAENEG